MVRSFLNIAKEYLQLVLLAVLIAFLTKFFVLDAVYVSSKSMEGTLLKGDYVLINKILYGAKSPEHLPLLESGFHLPGLRSIQRGDVIVFEFPEERDDDEFVLPKYFIKRCAGLPGDEISLRNGKVYVNGTLLNVPNHADAKPPRSDFEPVRVPKKGDVVGLSRSNFSLWENLIQHESHKISITGDGIILIDDKPSTSYLIEKDYLFVLGDNLDHSFDSRAWGFLPEDNVVGSAMMIYWSADARRDVDESENFFAGIRWDRIGKFVR